MARFFPEQAETSGFFDCLVLSGGLLETKNHLTPYKSGVHVIFQRVFVTVDMALYITAHIIHRLEREYRGSADEGAWAKRIDQNVYAEGRGLRWAWQLKTKPCASCNGAGYKSGCTSCGNGEVIDDRASMYVPVYTCKGVYERVREPVACRRDAPTIELLLASSIRAVTCLEPSYGFTLYPGHLPLPVFKRDVTVAPCGDAATRQARSSDDLLPKTDVRFALIAAAVKRMHKEYESIEIQKIAIRQYGFAVAVLGIGSCFCMNYGKDHAKQRVSFFVGRHGVTQSCYCKCDVIRSSGIRCRDYKSPKSALTAVEENKLFPSAKRPALSVAASAACASSLATKEPLRVNEADFFEPKANESAAMRQAIAKANTLARGASELTQQYTDKQLDELVAGVVFKTKTTRARRLKRSREPEKDEGAAEAD